MVTILFNLESFKSNNMSETLRQVLRLDYQLLFEDVAIFQWAVYRSISFLIPQRFFSIQRETEMTKRPKLFSNPITYCFSSLLYKACHVAPTIY